MTAYKKTMAIVALSLSAGAHAQTTVSEKNIGELLPKCSAPVASVSIGKLNCKASGCRKIEGAGQMGALLALASASGQINDFSNIGEGMSNALTTALKATNCFDVQEREAIEELRKEMELAGVKIEAKPADFLISGAITSVGMETQKTSLGGGFIPIIGGIQSTKKTANLAMDIRLVNVQSASVKASKSFEANNETSSWGIAGGGIIGAGVVGGAFSVTKSPVMDKIAAETIIVATSFIVDSLAKDAVVSRPALSTTKANSPSKTEDQSIPISGG